MAIAKRIGMTAVAAAVTATLWSLVPQSQDTAVPARAAVVAPTPAPVPAQPAATVSPAEPRRADAGEAAQVAGFTWGHAPGAHAERDAPLAIQRAQDAGPPFEDPRMSRRVVELARSESPQPVDVVLRFEGMDAAAIAKTVDAAGGRVVKSYRTLPLAGVRIPANRLALLASAEGVNFLEVNAPVQAASASALQTARVPAPGAANYLVPSANVGVAVLDSGVSAHADVAVASRTILTEGQNGLGGEFLDQFWKIGYAGSDGADPWSDTPWVERGDDGNAASGAITVERDFCPDMFSTCIEFDANAPLNTAIERAVNLENATAAWITTDFRVWGISGDVSYVLEASANGGAGPGRRRWGGVTTNGLCGARGSTSRRSSRRTRACASASRTRTAARASRSTTCG